MRNSRQVFSSQPKNKNAEKPSERYGSRFGAPAAGWGLQIAPSMVWSTAMILRIFRGSFLAGIARILAHHTSTCVPCACDHKT